MGATAEKWSTGADGPYWDGLAEGRLLLPACAACERWHWPAVWRCAACGSWDQNWRQVSLEGHIYSWTRTHHKFNGLEALETPFVIAVVELEEAGGIRLMGRLETSGPIVRIGQNVTGIISSSHCLGRDVPSILWRQV